VWGSAWQPHPKGCGHPGTRMKGTVARAEDSAQFGMTAIPNVGAGAGKCLSLLTHEPLL
jgi:hypothetical protein